LHWGFSEYTHTTRKYSWLNGTEFTEYDILIMKTISMVRSSFEKGLGAFCGYVDSRLFRPPKTSHAKNSKRLKPLPCTAEAEQHYLKSFRLLLAPVDEMHIIGVNTQILKLAEAKSVPGYDSLATCTTTSCSSIHDTTVFSNLILECPHPLEKN